MPVIEIDGFDCYFETVGEGPAVLLTHGFCASSAMWKSNAPAIAEAEFQVITWDMRGHGNSASPEDQNHYSADQVVSSIATLLDHLEIDQAVIGGMSLGGYMSLAFNLKHPERVRALMLIDTGPGFKKDNAREGWNDYARKRGDELLEQGEAALSKSAEAHLQAQNYLGLRNAAHGMLIQNSADAINSLPDISVPTLVVVGDRDEPFLAASDYMAAKIPGADKAVIAEAGHAANVDQPQAFNEAVLNFLAKL